MDKMTHTKFNLNNFLLAISSGIDCAVERNQNNISYSSQRVAFITMKIASFNDFTKRNLSDILSFTILSKHYTNMKSLESFPFDNLDIFRDELMKQIIFLAETVEENIDIKENFIINKLVIIEKIEALNIDEVIKENFFYLGESESFWLDLVSLRLPFFILDFLEDTTLEISYDELLLIVKEMSKIVYSYTQREFNTNLIDNLLKMAKIYNFDNKDSSRLLLCGYLYNIGLLKIPQEIIVKKGKLEQLEYDKMKSAPYYTKEILSMIYGFDDIAKLASSYCEKLDGSGYPYHLAGNELALKDRLLITLCLYQALGEERNYRRIFSKNEIFKILEDEASFGRIDSSVVNDLKAIL